MFDHPQVVVNAIIKLLEAGALGPGSAPPGSPAALKGAADAAAAQGFVCKLVAEGRVAVQPAFALQLLAHLTGGAAGGSAGSAGGAHGASASSREVLFTSVVQAVGISSTPVAGKAGGGGAGSGFSQEQARDALRLAQGAGLTRAAAALHHLLGDYSAALEDHLQAGDAFKYAHSFLSGAPAGKTCARECVGSQGRPAWRGARALVMVMAPLLRHLGQVCAFKQHVPETTAHQSLTRFVCGIPNTGQLPPAVHQRFAMAITERAAALVQADAAATAELVLRRLPEQQQALLDALQTADASGRLAFAFLRALLQHQQRGGGGGAAAAAGPQLPPRGTPRSGSPMRARAGKGHRHEDSLLSRPEVCDAYLRLLCAFAPEEVLPFLQGHEVFDVRAAIQHCRQHGVTNAEAFLHERLGDMEAAVQLHLRAVNGAADALEGALLAGRLPVMEPSAALSVGSLGLLAAAPQQQQARGGGGSGSSRSCAETAEQLAAALESMLAEVERPAGPPPSSSEPPGPSGKPPTQGGTAAVPRHSGAAAAAAAALAGAERGLAAHGSRLSGASTEMGVDPYQLFHQTVATDLHIAWLQALSPRLRPWQGRRAGDAVGHGHGDATMLGRSRSTGGSTRGTRGMTHAVAAAGAPPEAVALWQALQAGLAFCERSSRAATAAARGAEAQDAQAHWFALLNALVARLQRLNQQQQQQQQQPAGVKGALGDSSADWLAPVCDALATLIQSDDQVGSWVQGWSWLLACCLLVFSAGC